MEKKAGYLSSLLFAVIRVVKTYRHSLGIVTQGIVRLDCVKTQFVCAFHTWRTDSSHCPGSLSLLPSPFMNLKTLAPSSWEAISAEGLITSKYVAGPYVHEVNREGGRDETKWRSLVVGGGFLWRLLMKKVAGSLEGQVLRDWMHMDSKPSKHSVTTMLSSRIFSNELAIISAEHWGTHSHTCA